MEKDYTISGISHNIFILCDMDSYTFPTYSYITFSGETHMCISWIFAEPFLFDKIWFLLTVTSLKNKKVVNQITPSNVKCIFLTQFFEKIKHPVMCKNKTCTVVMCVLILVCPEDFENGISKILSVHDTLLGTSPESVFFFCFFFRS